MGARGPLGVFFAASRENADVGARADWNMEWGSAPTDLASKPRNASPIFSSSHGAC